eukprot:358092-Chlamydomonas_euryale.AAC.4
MELSNVAVNFGDASAPGAWALVACSTWGALRERLTEAVRIRIRPILEPCGTMHIRGCISLSCVAPEHVAPARHQSYTGSHGRAFSRCSPLRALGSVIRTEIAASGALQITAALVCRVQRSRNLEGRKGCSSVWTSLATKAAPGDASVEHAASELSTSLFAVG